MSLKDLIEQIKNEKNFYLKDILNKYNSFDWKEYVKLSNTNYNRIKIFENDILDVYIITWYLKAKSKIHDHAFNGCWLKVLNGKLEENVYDTNLNLVKTKTLDEGFISFISDNIGKVEEKINSLK